MQNGSSEHDAREEEQRLTRAVETISQALRRVAAGDLDVRVERDFLGDPADVLASLVNTTVSALATSLRERERRSTELEGLVEERTRQLRTNEESQRRLLDAAPVALLIIDPENLRIVQANQRAAQILESSERELLGTAAPAVHLPGAPGESFFERLRREGAIDGVSAQVATATGRLFWALLDARALPQAGGTRWMLGIVDITEQKRTEERLRELATTDPLTGALNRRQLYELAEEEVRRAERYWRPLCFAMLDLDHFKTVNDRFGHAIGDEALKAVAAAIRRSLRATDRLARHGGEEFVVMLPETPLSTAKGALERIRVSVAGLHFQARGEVVSITVSAGVVAWRSGESVDAVIDRADLALYEAKGAGRNRVVAAGDVAPPPAVKKRRPTTVRTPKHAPPKKVRRRRRR